ncbi:hypothetical protein CJP74_00220 [Psittacicella melopsittaci]|uniref:Site-specific DNA-methyltransferase (adenine-specific) n=1 Tax=Psittacicella melopsittaci TaxID=2028576 RepID=A0A3A1YA45_9GAMM|nr:hypothetical protein CJP74_00220 [Psittacicella melopsittaci]
MASPINYSGGKYKLLKQILPLFPKQIRHFYDVFAGGANVAVNVDAEQTIICDREQEVMKLFAYMQEHDLETMLKQIEELIATYELSNTKEKGYDFYQANSSAGLKEVNQQAYLQLRADYNQGKFKTDPELVFYVLLVYAFNNQIRFNAKGLFNMPPGKRDFNVQMEKKFKLFKQALDNKQLHIKCQDGIALLEQIDNPQDFVYLDPPYLISTASYNEGQGWTLDNELALLEALDELNARGVKFALSNVLAHKGKENTHLQQWAQKYKIHYLEHHYNNSNYQSQAGKHQTIEVLITNY